MHTQCIFCDIAQHNHQSEILFENDNLFVIRDIMPKAPVHLLVISKHHLESVNELTHEHVNLIGEIVLTAKSQAEINGVAESGYKLVWNVGKEGGQIIPHLHLHLLGGKELGE